LFKSQQSGIFSRFIFGGNGGNENFLSNLKEIEE